MSIQSTPWHQFARRLERCSDWFQVSQSVILLQLAFQLFFRFLYMLILCLNANFRLKNQLQSLYAKDPGLGTGLSYFGPLDPYFKYIMTCTTDEDVCGHILCLVSKPYRYTFIQISTCVGFLAIAQQNTRFSKGLCYTGVGCASCGQSEMIFPNGVGDLQKGERCASLTSST